MDRGLIFGAIAFGAAFGLERLLASLGPDIKRYSAMRKMSNEGSITKELLGLVGGMIGSHGATQSAASGIISGLTNDVVRYAKMKGM